VELCVSFLYVWLQDNAKLSYLVMMGVSVLCSPRHPSPCAVTLFFLPAIWLFAKTVFVLQQDLWHVIFSVVIMPCMGTGDHMLTFQPCLLSLEEKDLLQNSSYHRRVDDMSIWKTVHLQMTQEVHAFLIFSDHNPWPYCHPNPGKCLLILALSDDYVVSPCCMDSAVESDFYSSGLGQQHLLQYCTCRYAEICPLKFLGNSSYLKFPVTSCPSFFHLQTTIRSQLASHKQDRALS
jgi:hypothetical protein